ncbi:MAG TPA: hypothetical protein VL501_03325 [Pyrinomonadaceae bacterium]|nr:hypothetical protein [Pyrinomonadaceae bacterium]
MFRTNSIFRGAIIALSMVVLATAGYSQKSHKKSSTNDANHGHAIIWQKVDVARQDTYLGPGGAAMQPDVSHVELIKEEKGGHSKKYRVRDGAGNEWVAKVGDEAQSETAAVRLLSSLGYVTEVNYLIPKLTIKGAGTFSNVRLEARPSNVKRGKEWKWGHTPFEKTPQMKGLMMMMAFINNWDMKSANNVIIHDGDLDKYVISDLGVSFGKTGSNPLPIFWRIGRSRNKPSDYARTRLVSGVSDYKVRVVYNGKNRSRMHDFTKEDARWLADLLLQLSDAQIRDMFRAANYSAGDIHTLTKAVKARITQLDRAAYDRRIAGLR